jgi:hypothetical protein
MHESYTTHKHSLSSLTYHIERLTPNDLPPTSSPLLILLVLTPFQLLTLLLKLLILIPFPLFHFKLKNDPSKRLDLTPLSFDNLLTLGSTFIQSCPRRDTSRVGRRSDGAVCSEDGGVEFEGPDGGDETSLGREEGTVVGGRFGGESGGGGGLTV